MATATNLFLRAALRILHELERIHPDQQFEYIQSLVTSVQIKFLCGNDGVDRWTEQTLWDGLLHNVKVVVSTYQILLDALTHGFVHMESLAMIVFDEGRHPGAKIMWSFYHERKQKGLSVPHILGLTASPVMRSDPESLVKIESTLDAICRTPTKHRAELRLQVNLPVLSKVYYQGTSLEIPLTSYSKTMASLGKAFGSLHLEDDPYVLDLIRQGTEKSQRKLEKVRLNHKTWCHQQLKTLCGTSVKICQELGAWAGDYYVSSVVSRFMKMAEDAEDFQGGWDVSSAEKQYLAKALKNIEVVPLKNNPPAGTSLVTNKVNRLIETILLEKSELSGIVFVQERAMVAVLAHLLSVHPATRDVLRVGTMIGASASSYRQNIGEMLDVNMQRETLSLFKSGVLNLIVATSVLEEGIDVPVCNLVICFHEPANLKSFVQRRGRARHKKSKLVLLMQGTERAKEWEELERAMKAYYEEEMRQLQEVLQIEDSEEHDHKGFRVESTGAFLDLDNAMQHLYHFCATLPSKEYVDLTPEFICSETVIGQVKAKVILPLSVNEAVRTAVSRKSWMSEKNAIKDCAYEAYIALYKAGLVNNNLLPLLRHDALLDELTSTAVETRASIMLVHEQLDPWFEVAKAWNSLPDIRQYMVQFGKLEVLMHLPVSLPVIEPFTLYWDSETQISVRVQPESTKAEIQTLTRASGETWAMLQTAFGSRFQVEEKDLAILFSTAEHLSLRDQMGRQPALSPESSYAGLVRDAANNVPYLFKQWLPDQPNIEMVQKPYTGYTSVPKSTPHLALTKVAKRRDFLHKPAPGTQPSSDKPYSVVLPTSRCTVDEFPFEYAQFGLAIPSIMRRLEVYMLAELLRTTILRDVGIKDLGLIVTAISASSAREDTDYQRLEFFGDMMLKLCTAVQLVSEYPLWHEGYLSAKKDRLVANSRLSRAAVDTGLDRFIVTKPFTGHRWRPPYVDGLLQKPTEAQRNLSSKVLADVVEALIGAAMVDGGFPAALACLQVFLPELEWRPLEVRQVSLQQRAPDVALPPTLHLCEELCGRQFSKKSLLIEAMTHASCSSGAGSLERLEFLGDGVLDRIVTTTLYEHQPALSHFQMHVIRTALVNADFLGFMCLEWAVSQGATEIMETPPHGDEDERGRQFQVVPSRTPLPLWRFLRHHSPRLAAEQAATSRRHADLRLQIRHEIETGSRYPWALLASLKLPKVYSDIVESLLGAVWLDSGSWQACGDLLEGVGGIGVLPYARRILADGVQAWHPKEELGVLAGSLPVRYAVEMQRGGAVEGAQHQQQREFACSVFVGDEVVAQVERGVSREEVKTRAAEAAVRALTGGRTGGSTARESELEMEGLD